jgi:hypothetical protein
VMPARTLAPLLAITRSVMTTVRTVIVACAVARAESMNVVKLRPIPGSTFSIVAPVTA